MKTSTMARRAAALIALLMTAACGGDGATNAGGGNGGKPATEAVATVAVSPGTLQLEVGGEMEIEAEPLSASGRVLAGRAVTWTSSNEAVATVSAGGRLTARGAGEAIIRALVEGKAGEARVQVAAPAPVIGHVAVMPVELALEVGQQQAAVAIAYNTSYQAVSGLPVAWTSSDEQVATVMADGRVVAVGAGQAVVRATAGGKTGEARVYVRPVIGRVEVTPSMVQLKPGESWSFTARALSPAGEPILDRQVPHWSSSNPAVASVDAGGRVTAHAPGEAIIRGAIIGVTGEGRVVVPAAPTPDPEPTVFDLARADGKALRTPLFDRAHDGAPARVQVLGGYLKAHPFAAGGNTAQYEINVFLTVVRDGVWIDSETYHDEGTVERTDDGFIFRSTDRPGFTYRGRRGPDGTIVVTTTVGANSPALEYTFAPR